MGLEVGLQADIAETAIHPEWTTAAGIDLTIGKTAADREHIDAGRLGNLVWIGAEQVLRANRDRVFLSERIAHVEINRCLGPKHLARIVLLIAPLAEVVGARIDGPFTPRPVARQVQTVFGCNILDRDDLGIADHGRARLCHLILVAVIGHGEIHARAQQLCRMRAN
ncbi:MAG: hypothetical protein O9253_02220, partial [Aquidulcibacter sp.]|nr:hypothetical protein [Aquidulcibacter sp.]